MREERRLRMLRRIFGPKRDEVTEEWRKTTLWGAYDLYSSPYIVRVIEKNEMGGSCSTYGERRGIYRVLMGKLEGTRPLGRPSHRGGV